MPQKRKRLTRAPSIRHTQSAQDWILEQLVEAQRQGLTREDFARKHRVSVRSIYRWQQQRFSDAHTVKHDVSRDLSIAGALARLIDDRVTDRLLLLEALFKLIAWLRWPATPNNHPAAIAACIVTYLSAGQSVETLEQLDAAELSLVLRHVRIDVLRRVCTGQSISVPSFDIWPLRDQPYDELDFLANISWFLLAYQPPTTDYRDAVSLNKAYFASQNGIFRYKWPLSHNTFKKYWSLYGAAAPFLYVERFHSNLEFVLNPIHADFAESVDTLIADRTKLREYLSLCRAAVDMLSSRLDRRSLQAMHLPSFPIGLEAEPFHPPGLPSHTASVIRSYGRRE